MRRVSILGIPIDALTPADAVDRLRAMLDAAGQHHVATPNNEMLVAARRNAAFAAVLRSTALNLPDSTGLVLASRWIHDPLPARVPGVDAVTMLCAQLDDATPVFLLGGKPGVAERAAEQLRRRNPRLRVTGTFAGSARDADAQGIIDRINAASPHLLLVAYGAPRQELWIAKHLGRLPSVRVAMGVGGTFDFLAGTVKRAPRWMRAVGLEWLWRLALQPQRLPRIIKAVVVFPAMVMISGKGER